MIMHTINQIKGRKENLGRQLDAARCGKLREYVAGEAALTSDHEHRDVDDKPETSRVFILTISKGSTLAGNSNRAIKSYAQVYRQGTTEMMSVETVERPPKTPKIRFEPITITESDTVDVTFPHHDPMVITAQIAHFEFGVSKDLLDRRWPALVAFGGGHIQPIKHMPFTLSIGVHSRCASITTDFIMAECPSSYNVILDCP
ncbi:unnamed protein product [Prunus armeniaca]